MSGRWEFWVDRGGTFTDVIGHRPDGTLVSVNLLFHDPGRHRDVLVVRTPGGGGYGTPDGPARTA